jgi:hypothetical protein
MNYKFLSKGEGHSSAGKKHTADPKPVNKKPELGALKLTADEVTQFEQWMTEPNKPTETMVEAAKAHRVLQLKLKR